MDNHASRSQIERAGRSRFVPWESLEHHTASAFTLAGTSLLVSLFVPIGLGTFVERSWLAGTVLVGIAVVAAALGLLGLHPRAGAGSPWLSTAGAAFATIAGIGGSVVLALSALTGAALHLAGLEFSVGRQAFVVLSLATAGGYGLGFLSYGIGTVRSRLETGRVGELLTVGGLLLLIPVVGGVLQLGNWIVLPARVVFPILGLVAVDTVAVGLSLRSTS